MTTLFWNVRGARRKALHGHMHHLLQKHNPLMVILLETKVEEVSNNRTFMLLSRFLPSNIIVPGTGHGGGLWMCWDPLMVEAELIEDSPQHINLSRNLEADKAAKGLFTAIYALPNWHVLRNLWENLSHFKANQCPPSRTWVLLGDFISILNPHEKHGGVPMGPTPAIKDFQNFIFDTELEDIGYVGP